MGLIFNNPVLEKEMRVRARGWRGMVLLGVYASALCCLVALLYFISRKRLPHDPAALQQFIRTVFQVVGVAQVGLAALIAPALTASGITLEREQRTLDVLRVTTVRAREIVVGKLVSCVFFGFMMSLSSAPLLALNGIAVPDIVGLLGVSALSLGAFGALGLLCSAVFKRTAASLAGAYAVALYMLAGTVLTDFVLDQVSGYTVPVPLTMVANPCVIALAFITPEVFRRPGPLTVQLVGCGLLLGMALAGLVASSILLRRTRGDA